VKYLSLQRTIEKDYGRVKIKIYGGFNEIGGNCIVIQDGDKRIVFDNGIRFSTLRKYYGGRIEPRGPQELRSIGAIPPAEVFSEATAVYISHFHLDHVGLLSAIPPGVNIKVPSTEILEKTLSSWYRSSGSWLAYIPLDYAAKVEEVQPRVEDENGVIAIPVSHSCYPAYSFLYRGSDAVLFYSGDLRVEPLTNIHGHLDLLQSIDSLGLDSVDVALIEGTNFSTDHMLMTPTIFREHVSLSLKEYDFVSISIDPLDLEAFMAILDSSILMERGLVIGSERLLWMVEELEKIGSKALENMYIVEELEAPTTVGLEETSLTRDVLKRPQEYTVIIEPVGLLKILRRLKVWGEAPDLAGSVLVLTDPEPRESIKEVEEEALRAWLRIFGVQTYRVRFSGHYLPHQFPYIIERVKPRELIPIHTEEPNIMIRLFTKVREAK
jgi:ribonuclease J